MVRRIAVLRALYLGDFLCAQPALRALKARFPLAELTLIGLPWIEPFLRRYACVDDFLAFPGCEGIAEVPYNREVTEAFLERARGLRFDLAVQMHGSGPASNDFVAALGAPTSLGYTPRGEPGPLTKCVPYPGDAVHEVRKWLGLVAHVGATGPARPELPVTPEEEHEAESLLAPLDRTRPLVALHAGSRDPARRWPGPQSAPSA
ncbi:MAG: LPS biosynthesis glycosyltransferase, partial [Anaerolineae bacterium]|nr:LPS biosynthesis glycosyltransferase [Anaerolineae bacterium]